MNKVKLKGNPWSAMYRGDGFHVRALLIALITTYTNLGWRLMCSTDISSKCGTTDTGYTYLLDVHSWYFMFDESLLTETPPPSYESQIQ